MSFDTSLPRGLPKVKQEAIPVLVQGSQEDSPSPYVAVANLRPGNLDFLPKNSLTSERVLLLQHVPSHHPGSPSLVTTLEGPLAFVLLDIPNASRLRQNLSRQGAAGTGQGRPHTSFGTLLVYFCFR